MLNQLQTALNLSLAGYSDLQALEQWLLSNLQAILDSGDAVAISVANQLDADLVEFSEGLIDELTLREHLESYLRHTESVQAPRG